MMHWKLHTVRLDFEGDVEWDGCAVVDGILWINYKGGTWRYSAFEADGYELDIEEFKSIWGIKDIQRLGRSHCKAGYTDRLNPEKSWTGHNPETLAKLKKYIEQLEKEANGSKPGKD